MDATLRPLKKLEQDRAHENALHLNPHSMWSQEGVSSCPKCAELTYEFDRQFPGLLKYNRETYFPVLAYYCPACDHVIVEAYHSKDDRDVLICPRDSDWRVKAPANPPRLHAAYDPDHISKSAVIYHVRLEFYRTVRQRIGRIVRTDDPKAELQIQGPVNFDPETFRDKLDTLLRNTASGRVSAVSSDGRTLVFQIQVYNRMRFRIQLDRLRRRFTFPETAKLYYFNEDRPYIAPPWNI